MRALWIPISMLMVFSCLLLPCSVLGADEDYCPDLIHPKILQELSDCKGTQLFFHNGFVYADYRFALNDFKNYIPMIPGLQGIYEVRLSPIWRSYAGFKLNWNTSTTKSPETTWWGTTVYTRTNRQFISLEMLISYRHFLNQNWCLRFQSSFGMGVSILTTYYDDIIDAPSNTKALFFFTGDIVTIELGYELKTGLWLVWGSGLRLSKILFFKTARDRILEVPVQLGLTLGWGKTNKYTKVY